MIKIGKGVKMEENKDDMPKSIVVILVVVAVAISVLGTFTVLTELSKLHNAPVYEGNPTDTAKISFTVIDPNEGIAGATGKITFQIIEPKEVN